MNRQIRNCALICLFLLVPLFAQTYDGNILLYNQTTDFVKWIGLHSVHLVLSPWLGMSWVSRADQEMQKGAAPLIDPTEMGYFFRKQDALAWGRIHSWNGTE
ncbi:hypothetical protein GF406_13960 [candidate division KSB1 bacterium]|nr:hypothetical protein [candidate division KSB1 bacterium]